MPKGAKGKGKGKSTYRPSWRSGFFGGEYQGDDWTHEHEIIPEHDTHEDIDDGSYVGLFAQEPDEEVQEYADDEVEESEAAVLNAVSELGDPTDGLDLTSVGEAIQLELAAMAAFGKAKRKKGKGKGKGKGKLVRSNLTLDQRRQNLSEIKAKSKCLRCGGMDTGQVIRSASSLDPVRARRLVFRERP